MPPINHAAFASVGIVAASVAVAAAIALYESPEVRRLANDLRRRIAIALHALGDNVDPARRAGREPRFNRPEDAEGFYQSYEMDADEETRRRQREELLYWNAVREEQRRRERESEEQQQSQSRGSTFDDFLEFDSTGDRGTLVYNSGANTRRNGLDSELRQRRGNTSEDIRGLQTSVISNPFSDEYGINTEEQIKLLSSSQVQLHDGAVSDIYGATPRIQSPRSQGPVAAASEILFDFESHSVSSSAQSDFATALGDVDDRESQASTLQDLPPRPRTPIRDVSSTPTAHTPSSNTATLTETVSVTPSTTSTATLEYELGEDEYMTAGQELDDEAYAAIQAWAHAHAQARSHTVSSAPSEISAVVESESEAEIISEGQLTPVGSDSTSVVGEWRNVTAAPSTDGDEYVVSDHESEGGDGIPTPGSWSDVGSVVSGSERAFGRS
ncbi:uncharacterized protein CTHT_0033620 [Thermochaetoides thermophila DSM 1495]|uniref:Uncharacterized protein n=1 Tax=Chaetomium thermophilum (strain DSM 1495 / CBS 144.50 / IMI 039719) TaxID=759272 RepID=G0S5U2_CHATD|nr:hypothetical protein CTHT_0033620 [Thermochaetoides thermophila DSM 1495]EGS21504.1 hypothetical protein CTHT_0033620 [Thermochaetoides thermophila DSM 1495]